MSTYTLEINENPPVKAYNHHAFGTGIITTIKKGMNWMFNNYIQLSYYPKDGPLTFDFYMDYIYCQPVFDTEHLTDDTMCLLKWNPIKLFSSVIMQGKYVTCCVNEYHIPNRDAYMSYHFKHNILIYGFDDIEKVFYTAGYDDEGKYSVQKVAYKQLLKASPSDIYILTLRKNLDYELYVNHIDRQIRQYNGELPLDPIGSYPKEGRTTGIEAVNAMLGYICQAVEVNTSIDIKPICILMEHRKLMLERLRALNSKGIVSSNIVEEFAPQVKNCEILRNRVMLYNMRDEKKDGEAIMKLQAMHRDVRMPEIL